MTPRLLSRELVGAFFAVGSVSDSSPESPLSYVRTLQLPYWYQLPALREEDMVRQFAYVIEGFEEKGEFTLDVDVYTYWGILENNEPITIDESHAHGLYLLRALGTHFPVFKTQQTAPATMCFTIRDSRGHNLVSPSMLRFFTALMRRIAEWQYEFLSDFCDSVILCQDDPALGFVLGIIDKEDKSGLTVRQIVRETESVFPPRTIPSYHYCEDWRTLEYDGTHLLWETSPKIVHIDVLTYPPMISEKQSEKINRFLERGGAVALGVLPNTNDGYDRPVRQLLERNLTSALRLFADSGVDVSLLADNVLISTQCGLSRASPELVREIHHTSECFPEVLEAVLGQTT